MNDEPRATRPLQPETPPHRSSLILHRFDPDLAPARSIKFTEEDALPGSELKLPSLHDDLRRGSHHAGLHMSRRIAFTVAVPALPRDHPVEDRLHVRHHVRIGMFINGHAGGGMGHKDRDQAFVQPALFHRILHFVRDLHEFRSTACFHRKLFHCAGHLAHSRSYSMEVHSDCK